MRPGLVIGRGGETIKELAASLEEKFKLSNPQISVSEIEIPEFNASVVANRVSSALQRGVHFRRAGFWALNQVMEAGALGCEIVISGKLRTERARFEKFRAGYFPRCGEPALRFMKKAEAHVQLKPGMIGVRVKLMPPDAQFPDKIKIAAELPIEEETEIIASAPVVIKAPEPAPKPEPVPEPVPEETVVAEEITDEPVSTQKAVPVEKNDSPIEEAKE
jgi:small subunit ribosomal protein S3